MKATMLAAVVAVSYAAADLPPVIVEASRLDQSKKEIASHVDVITRPDIDSSGAQNTVEVLEKRANLFIRKTNSNPTLSQISMRGFGANGFGRTKILVDGEELNNPDMTPQNLMRVPLRSIQRIEILHGPQPILHGGNATAGVINIISDTASYDRKSDFEVHGGNLGAIGAHAGTRGGLEDKEITYFADLDFDRSDGWRDNSWYDIWSVKCGLRQSFDNKSWWSIKSFFTDSQYGLPGGLYSGGDHGNWKSRAREADDNASKAHNDVYGFTLSGLGVIDNDNSLSADFSFRERQSESYGYIEYDVFTFDYKLKFTNTSSFSDFDNRFDIGTDIKHDIVDADAYNTAMNSGGDNDFRRFSTAVFAREEFWLLEELSWFFGTRTEWFDSKDKFYTGSEAVTECRTKNSTAFETGLNWCPDDDIKVFARWTKFYHAPMADEMFSAYGIPNMSLKPEQGHNTEIGTDWTFLDDFNFMLTGFHMELDDEIMYLNYANCNADEHTARSGIETSLTWAGDKIGNAGIMYTYVYSRFTEGEFKGNDMPMVPHQQLRLFGEYCITDEIAAGGGYRLVGKQRYGSDYTGEGGFLPSYGICDLSLRVQPTGNIFDGFTFALAVDNLFDKRYCDYGEYFESHYVYPASGRSIMFSMRYEF